MSKNREIETEDYLEDDDEELLDDRERQSDRGSDPFFWLAANIEKISKSQSESELKSESESESAIEAVNDPFFEMAGNIGSKKKKKKKSG